jgi:predicted aspartyl protease
LSLHALSGQPQHRAIQLSALVKNQVLVVPIDSGSSHTFLNSVLAQKLQATTTPLPPMSVKVANGASLSCTAEVKNFELWVQGYTFQVDAKLIDIGAYDLVLGMDWMERFSPMTCDWLAKWIEFSY